jgi:hypothetical protein
MLHPNPLFQGRSGVASTSALRIQNKVQNYPFFLNSVWSWKRSLHLMLPTCSHVITLASTS